MSVFLFNESIFIKQQMALPLFTTSLAWASFLIVHLLDG